MLTSYLGENNKKLIKKKIKKMGHQNKIFFCCYFLLKMG